MKYLVFVAYYLYSLAIISGTAYLVFWKDASGWWFVLAALLINNSPEFKTTNE